MVHSPCLFDVARSLSKQILKAIYISDFNSHAEVADINLTVKKVLTVILHFKNTNSILVLHKCSHSILGPYTVLFNFQNKS